MTAIGKELPFGSVGRTAASDWLPPFKFGRSVIEKILTQLGLQPQPPPRAPDSGSHAWLRRPRLSGRASMARAPGSPGEPVTSQREQSTTERQGRTTDDDGSHYDFSHVVFEPLHMSQLPLHAGHVRVLTQLYSWRDAGRRFVRQAAYLSVGLIAKAANSLNLSHRVRLRAAGTMPA